MTRLSFNRFSCLMSLALSAVASAFSDGWGYLRSATLGAFEHIVSGLPEPLANVSPVDHADTATQRAWLIPTDERMASMDAASRATPDAKWRLQPSM